MKKIVRYALILAFILVCFVSCTAMPEGKAVIKVTVKDSIPAKVSETNSNLRASTIKVQVLDSEDNVVKEAPYVNLSSKSVSLTVDPGEYTVKATLWNDFDVEFGRGSSSVTIAEGEELKVSVTIDDYSTSITGTKSYESNTIYDTQGNRIEAHDYKYGVRTSSNYYENGKLVRWCRYHEDGETVSFLQVIESNGTTTSAHFAANGNKTSEHVLTDSVPKSEIMREYDANGELSGWSLTEYSATNECTKYIEYNKDDVPTRQNFYEDGICIESAQYYEDGTVKYRLFFDKSEPGTWYKYISYYPSGTLKEVGEPVGNKFVSTNYYEEGGISSIDELLEGNDANRTSKRFDRDGYMTYLSEYADGVIVLSKRFKSNETLSEMTEYFYSGNVRQRVTNYWGDGITPSHIREYDANNDLISDRFFNGSGVEI